MAWPHVRVNGVRAAGRGDFGLGSEITWREVCLELHGASVTLEDVINRAVLRIAGSEHFRDGLCRDEPLVENRVYLTNGNQQYSALIVRTPELSRPLLVFHDLLPDPQARLWVCAPQEHNALAAQRIGLPRLAQGR